METDKPPRTHRSGQQRADDRVVAFDEIREEDGGKHSVELRFFVANSRYEPAQLSENALRVSRKGRVLGAWQLDDFGVRHVLADVTGLLDGLGRVVGPVQHERGHHDGGQYRPYVGLHLRPREGQGCTARGRQARVASPSPNMSGIAADVR